LPKVPSVGDWVLVKATSRRSVDRLKAKTPCLVTLVADGRVQVLYPNQLAVFLHQKDGEVSVRFRTEACDLADVRAYRGEAASLLDRKMIVALCSSVAGAAAASAAKRGGETAPAPMPAANPPEESPPECLAPAVAVRDQGWLLAFTAGVAQAFRAEGREVLDRAALAGRLAGAYTPDELDEGLAALDRLNKVMIADNAIFLVV